MFFWFLCVSLWLRCCWTIWKLCKEDWHASLGTHGSIKGSKHFTRRMNMLLSTHTEALNLQKNSKQDFGHHAPLLATAASTACLAIICACFFARNGVIPLFSASLRCLWYARLCTFLRSVLSVFGPSLLATDFGFDFGVVFFCTCSAILKQKQHCNLGTKALDSLSGFLGRLQRLPDTSDLICAKDLKDWPDSKNYSWPNDLRSFGQNWLCFG